MKKGKWMLIAVAVVSIVLMGGLSSVWAVPVPGQIVPVAVYSNTTSAFGLAYDSVNDIIDYTQGDSGDSLIHTVKAYKNYTAAEIAAFPLNGGVQVISLANAQHDVAGTTSPLGGAYFRSLAFDSASGQLVMQGSGVNLQSFDPFTAAFPNSDYAPGSADQGFSDGLDVDGGDVWYSGDVQHILKNGGVFADPADSTQTVLPGWAGLDPYKGKDTTWGWSGVERVGDSVFAVAVMTNDDTGLSRTIVRFDAATGELLGYDPDGDPAAARWEDLAYDGRYLYAADLRGDFDSNNIPGDIYVFDVTGGLDHQVPEPATMLLLGTGLIGLASIRRKFKK